MLQLIHIVLSLAATLLLPLIGVIGFCIVLLLTLILLPFSPLKLTEVRIQICKRLLIWIYESPGIPFGITQVH